MANLEKTARYAQNIVEDVQYEIVSVPQSCQRNRLDGKRGLEVDNWLRLSLSCVRLAAVELRGRSDERAARDALGAAHRAAGSGADAFDYYDRRGEIAASPMFRSLFTYGFASAWLANDANLSKRFAEMCAHGDLRIESGDGDFGSVNEIAARMSCAVARDDIEDLQVWRARFDTETGHAGDRDAYWRKYFIFPSLMQALLERDNRAFAQLLSQADQLFAARGKDAWMDNAPLDEAGPKFNALLIDYRSTALGQLALQRGMAVDFDSPRIPIRTIWNWREPTASR